MPFQVVDSARQLLTFGGMTTDTFNAKLLQDAERRQIKGTHQSVATKSTKDLINFLLNALPPLKIEGDGMLCTWNTSSTIFAPFIPTDCALRITVQMTKTQLHTTPGNAM